MHIQQAVNFARSRSGVQIKFNRNYTTLIV